MRSHRGLRGQAAVELLALLPALILVTAVCLAVALGAARWLSAAGQARAAERALEVGTEPRAPMPSPRPVGGPLGPIPLPAVRPPSSP